MKTNKFTEEARQTIDQLIKAGTTFDLEQLELIYHDDLEVIMIDDEGQKMTATKAEFQQLFTTKKANGDPPLNTWADYQHLSASSEKAHVVVTRKVNLTGEERKLLLSIDLINESGRWQVVREVIFSLPL